MTVANHNSLQKGSIEIILFPSLATPGLPPIHRIPVELLAEIIFWCRCASYSASDPKPPSGLPSLSRVHLNESTDAHTLSQVCRYWRSVALATPTLWSSITMNKPERRDFATIRLWLDRSGSSPLHLSLVETPPPGSGSKNLLTEALFAILTTEVHRWKDIYFRFGRIIEPSLLKLPVGALKQLKSARISSRHDDLPRRAQLWDIIHASPSFQEAGWDEAYIGKLADKVPWPQITAVRLTFLGVSHKLSQILHSCHSNIVKLDLQFWRSPKNNTPHTKLEPPLILPHLRDLTVHTETELDQFFDRFTLPRLHSLSIQQSLKPNTHSNHLSLEELLARSKCQLRNLSYSDEKTETDIFTLLASPHLSSLTELEIVCPLRDRTMLRLTHSTIDLDTNILPQLEKFILGQYRTSPGTIAAMVSSRRLKPAGASRLIELSLKTHIRHQKDVDQFKILGMNGLIVSRE